MGVLHSLSRRARGFRVLRAYVSCCTLESQLSGKCATIESTQEKLWSPCEWKHFQLSCICLGFALHRSVIGLKNSCHFLNQSEVKAKPVVFVARVFPRKAPVTCPCLIDCFIVLLVFAVIGVDNYFVFGDQYETR